MLLLVFWGERSEAFKYILLIPTPATILIWPTKFKSMNSIEIDVTMDIVYGTEMF